MATDDTSRQALFGMQVDWESRTVLIHLPPVPEQGGIFTLDVDTAEALFRDGLGLVAQIRGVAKVQDGSS